MCPTLTALCVLLLLQVRSLTNEVAVLIKEKGNEAKVTLDFLEAGGMLIGEAPLILDEASIASGPDGGGGIRLVPAAVTSTDERVSACEHLALKALRRLPLL